MNPPPNLTCADCKQIMRPAVFILDPRREAFQRYQYSRNADICEWCHSRRLDKELEEWVKIKDAS